MMPLQFTKLKSILCIGAHGDDIEIGCAGTLKKLMAQYPEVKVHWAVFSASVEREQEIRSSANALLGSDDSDALTLHNFRDSYFPCEYAEIKDAMHTLSQAVNPDIVFTHRKDDAHQDHRLLSELTWCAFRRQLVLEYEIPKYEGDLGQPNVYVSLSSEIAQWKVRHLMSSFPSQIQKSWYSADTFNALMRLRGIENPTVDLYSEGFYARKIVM